MKVTRQLIVQTNPFERLADIDSLMRVFGSAQRFAFNRLLEGVKKGDLIKDINRRFRINKRYAEDAVLQAEAIISSQRELLPTYLEEVKRKLAKTKAKLEAYCDGTKKPPRSALPLVLKGLAARIEKLEKKRAYYQTCIETNTIPKVIFGGKRAFFERVNGDITNQEWKDLRADTLYARGDKAKKGNLNIRIVYDESQEGFYLEVANPLAGEEKGKAPRLRYPLHIPHKWAHEVIEVVMPSVVGYTPKKKVIEEYVAYTVEIKRKNGRYYVFVTYELEVLGHELKGIQPLTTVKTAGIDVNLDRVTVSIVSAQGNKVTHRTFYCHDMETVSSNRRHNIAGELACDIVDYLLSEGVRGLVVEELKFLQDHDTHKPTNRRLHNFAHKKLQGALYVRALKNGLVVKKVNPAYTSVIARFKYQEMYGMSVHEAASFVIARRGLGHSERIPSSVLHALQDGVTKHLRRLLGSMEEIKKPTEAQVKRKNRLTNYLTTIQQFKTRHDWSVWNVVNQTLKMTKEGCVLQSL